MPLPLFNIEIRNTGSRSGKGGSEGEPPEVISTLTPAPSRYPSPPLPGKPLIMIKGKPLIQYVYERVKASSVEQVIVATDDERIATAVKGFGGEAILTS